MNSAMVRLVRAELRLMVREPLTVVFVFVFPVVTMLIIGASFGSKPSDAFDGANPSWATGSPRRDRGSTFGRPLPSLRTWLAQGLPSRRRSSSRTWYEVIDETTVGPAQTATI
jgi:hypothetical protein